MVVPCLEDCEKKHILFYLDRSNGGASIHDGSVEIMIHRRILTNDSITQSLAEPLNETAYGKGLVVRGKHLLIIETPNNSASVHRTNAQQLYMQPISTFSLTNLSYAAYSTNYRQTWSALVDTMPHNLHLLTLDQLGPKQYLVRVEHYFELDEDAIYSQPIQIDLQQLLYSLGEIDTLSVVSEMVGADFHHEPNMESVEKYKDLTPIYIRLSRQLEEEYESIAAYQKKWV